MTTADIIGQIDELAADEKCPHCDRAWHELALTRKVDQMFQSGTLDPNYFAREDMSPILCDGSAFIGPLRPEPLPTYASGGRIISGGASPAWISTLIQSTWEYVGDVMEWPSYSSSHYSQFTQKWVLGAGLFAWQEWFTPPKPACDGPLPEVDVEFGPQNWPIITEPVNPPKDLLPLIAYHYWADCIKPDIPTPESPGLDFSELINDSEPYYLQGKKALK